MENQSGPFTVSDTIVAIILSMRALGLGIFLSAEFREDFDAIVAHVDAIIQQQRAGHINLECGLVATTFQHQCNVVLRKRRAAEALEEATTVAGYASLERGCTNLGACNCDDDKEIIRAENYTSESDEDVKAAQAYLAAEDALFAHDVAVGEAVAEDLALEEHFLSQSCDDEYLCNDYECTCEGRYGLNDDGEIRYHDCH